MEIPCPWPGLHQVPIAKVGRLPPEQSVHGLRVSPRTPCTGFVVVVVVVVDSPRKALSPRILIRRARQYASSPIACVSPLTPLVTPLTVCPTPPATPLPSVRLRRPRHSPLSVSARTHSPSVRLRPPRLTVCPSSAALCLLTVLLKPPAALFSPPETPLVPDDPPVRAPPRSEVLRARGRRRPWCPLSTRPSRTPLRCWSRSRRSLRSRPAKGLRGRRATAFAAAVWVAPRARGGAPVPTRALMLRCSATSTVRAAR